MPETPGPTTLLVVCPECCEQVEVGAGGFNLYVYETDQDQTHYTFTCPQCNQFITKPVSLFYAGKLVKAGIEPKVPCWLLEQKPVLGPMDEDEVIDLMVAINTWNKAAAEDGNVLVGDED